MKHLAFIITIAFFISCSNKKEGNSSSNKIIFLTNHYENWIRANKTLDNHGRWDYGKKMMDTLYYTYFSKCEYAALFNEESIDTGYVLDPVMQNKILEQLKAKEPIIKDRINSALLKCEHYLPYAGINIFIFPSMASDTILQNLGGVSGVTLGSKDIMLIIDPLAKDWENALQATMAHEFHHAYWTKTNFRSGGSQLLDRLVFEGKAEVFSHMIYPGLKSPWDTLNATRKKQLWIKIKNQLDNTDFRLQDEIMFGSKEYPPCTGYILGRDLVEAALKKNPSIEAKHWTNFSPDYILKKSDY